MNYMSYFWTFQMVTVCKGHRFLLDEKMLIPNYSIIAFIICSITVWEKTLSNDQTLICGH